ncbi:MAG TPA: replicative DNA helicase [Gaiellaceae bacterium]
MPTATSDSTAATTAPVPPHSLDAEESVLGAMLLSPAAIEAVIEVVDAGDFYRETHGTIFRSMLALYGKGEPVDAITVVDQLEKEGLLAEAGGVEKIQELASLVPAAANAGHYARIVHELATLRGLIRVGFEISRLGFERPGEIVELLDRAEQQLFELSQQRVSTQFAHIDDLLKDSFERITALYEAGSDITGTPSGYRDIDRLTSGFQPGNLIIIAARPSMGKSALALCMAANVSVRQQLPVALFTLEMSKAEVTQRLMCSEGKVESQRLRTGKLAADDWPRLTAACDKLSKAPIYVDDTGSITMMEIRSKLRRLKSREPKLGLVIIDYLQLMTSGTTAENRVQEVSQISRSLKVLARDLEVPIMALSQLSRAVEQRQDKRPILSDLRESGCLSGETRVYLPDEGVYRPIADLVGRAGFRVLAIDAETGRLEPRRVTCAFATGWRPVYRLTTRLGRRIRATGNHKFLAFDGWRCLDDLVPGMPISVPRALLGPEDGPVDAAELSELALLGHLIGDGGSLPRRASVPERVFRQPAEGIAAFLRHLWGTGGSILPGNVRYESVNERLVADVQSLLLRLGIVASRRELRTDAYGGLRHRVTVSGEAGVHRFHELVGGAQPARPAARALAAAGVGGGSLVLAPEAAVRTGAPAVSDVCWDEIVSIEPDGEDDVYDLTVEGLHSFVAEDVVVHNSIEQDADLVMFVYRDEYYNPEETDSAGVAELLLAKHRNGATGMEKLAFQKRYAKFSDLAAG